MKWLQVIITISSSGRASATAYICFGPGEESELSKLHEELRQAATDRGISSHFFTAFQRSQPPGSMDNGKDIPQDVGAFLDSLLAEAVEIENDPRDLGPMDWNKFK